MMFRTPEFWYRDSQGTAPLVEHALGLFAPLYQFGHRINFSYLQKPYKAKIPIICVGGAVAGGSGKTPVCISLMRFVLDHGLAKKPAFMMRGYGGSEQEGVIESSAGAIVEQYGDEALLLSEIAPVIVSKNRAVAAQNAASQGYDLLMLDDGLQNNTLHKDLTFLVVDGAVGFGNGRTLPAGPLREPVADAARKADIVVMLGEDRRNVRDIYFNKTKVLQAFSDSIYEGDDKEVFAFAGIGRPQKFFGALEAQGLTLVDTQKFADHHIYSASEISKLKKKAEAMDAALVTTQKDMVRLKSAGLDDGVEEVGQTLRWDDEKAVLALLKGVLA